jgi:8-hydroxy-5-deazaflavin:NADPH oxidoreductase
MAIDAGYNVVLCSSRGPEILNDLIQQLGPHAQAATPAQAAASGDIVVTIPLKAFRQVPAEPLAGKVVIDTTNYLPDRDGHIAALGDQNTTTSELLQAHLPASHVVKAFNTIFSKHLATLARVHDAPGRSALPIAGDLAVPQDAHGATRGWTSRAARSEAQVLRVPCTVILRTRAALMHRSKLR